MKPNTPRPDADNGSEQRTSAGGGESGCQQGVAVQQQTPLPKMQVFTLCLMAFSEPVSLFVIFPFVNQMLEELGVTSDPRELGYYSGFVEGVFSIAQFFTIYFWGKLSDEIGRRPVLISGLCGVVASIIMFGLSRSYSMVVVARALSGMLNGNSAVIKSVLGEITDETNQGTAFAYLMLCWSLGLLLAPAIGGSLSHPAERYPSILGFELFREYPFLLPCLVGSVFSTLGLIFGILFLEETITKGSGDEERRSLLGPKPQTYPQSYSAPAARTISSANSSPEVVRPTSDGTEGHALSVKDIISNLYIRKILVGSLFTAYVTTAISAVAVLWLYTPVNAGGMELTSAQIGTALVLSGIVGNVMVNTLSFALGHMLAVVAGREGAYLGAGAVLLVRSISGMVFVCNTLLVTRSAPNKRSRGAINGLAQMASCASRGVGPAMSTSLFAFSVKSNILGGNLVWLVLSLVGLWGVVVAYQIPKDRPLDAESQGRNSTESP